MSNSVNIICSVLSNKIIIDTREPKLIAFLKDLGCKRKLFKRNIWVLPYANEQQLSSYLAELRNVNCLFSGGYGWSPSAIFQHLRDRGFLTGKIKEVIWTKPETKIAREV